MLHLEDMHLPRIPHKFEGVAKFNMAIDFLFAEITQTPNVAVHEEVSNECHILYSDKSKKKIVGFWLRGIREILIQDKFFEKENQTVEELIKLLISKKLGILGKNGEEKKLLSNAKIIKLNIIMTWKV